MKVGFIGIGMMGKPMITNLIKAGYELVVHDVSMEAVGFAVKAGAEAAGSPKRVAEACRVVCTSLPGPTEIESVVLHDNGILAGAKPGDIYIDFSTNSPSLIRRIAGLAKEKGVDVLDAPLSGGGANVAWERGHTATVGGDKAVLEKVRGIIGAVSANISYCGSVGSGMLVKLINNYAGFVCFNLFFEAMSLAAKEDLDLNVMWERFTNNILGPLFKKWLPARLFVGNFEPLFTIDLMYKDVKLALEEGKELNVPMYHGALALEKLVEARTKGLGQKDLTAVALLYEELLNIQIRV